VKALNIGCGSVFHSDWINIDLVPFSSQVLQCDFRNGLPYSDNELDICYSSHVIEHLTQQEARSLLSECFRVLSSQGVIRVVVPDLESIVKCYLHALNSVESGDRAAIPDYDWMMLELYDQTVRSFTGGEMGRYLASSDIQNKAFIVSRIGAEAENYWDKQTQKQAKVNQRSLLTRITSKSWNWWWATAKAKATRNIIHLLLGQQAQQAFDEGFFRQSGEIHRWMYDRFSLRRLLEQAGFVDVKVCRAEESRIPEFDRYQLDRIDGRVRKPDSLFMEGIKP
jgi:predicted SAM-dependent methyltransferase